MRCVRVRLLRLPTFLCANFCLGELCYCEAVEVVYVEMCRALFLWGKVSNLIKRKEFYAFKTISRDCC